MCDAREGMLEKLDKGSDNAFYLSMAVDTFRISALEVFGDAAMT
jgi:hypothetical protein